jgi:hypothetical protein
MNSESSIEKTTAAESELPNRRLLLISAFQIRFLPRTHPLQQESGRQLGALRQGGKPNPYKKGSGAVPMAPASDLDRSHNSRCDCFLHTLDAHGTSLTARLRFNKAEGDMPDVRDELINSSISTFVCGSSGNAIRGGEPAA